MGQGTGVGVVEHHGSAEGTQSEGPFRSLFNRATPASVALAISLLLSGLVVALYTLRTSQTPRRLLECTLLLSILVVFPLAVFPNQANYFGFSRVLLLAALMTGGIL